MSMVALASNEVVVVTPAAPLDDHELNNHEFFTSFSRNKSEEAPPNVELSRNESASSDDYSDEYSDDDRMLVKKSSMRRRDSPSTNKNVSWNENVTRQTEHRLTVERLKPAAEPVMPRQWFAPYHGYEYYQQQQYPQHYQQQQRGGGYYSYHHGDRSYRQEDRYSRREHRRGYGGGRRGRTASSSNHRGRKSNRKQQSSHNPSAMLSAWIDRDN